MITILITLILNVCGLTPKLSHYPIVNHDGQGGSGPRVVIYTSKGDIEVTPIFSSKEDEWLYDSLEWRIKYAVSSLGSNNIVFAPPAIYFIGDIDPSPDKWGRPKLNVSDWYIISPFLEMDTETELVDFAKTKINNTFNLGHFSRTYFSTMQLGSLNLSKHLKPISKGQYSEKCTLNNFVSLFPVINIDIKTSTAELLRGDYHPYKTKTLKIVFSKKEDHDSFFSKKNLSSLEKKKGEYQAPSLFLIGVYDSANNVFKADSWQNKPLSTQ